MYYLVSTKPDFGYSISIKPTETLTEIMRKRKTKQFVFIFL